MKTSRVMTTREVLFPSCEPHSHTFHEFMAFIRGFILGSIVGGLAALFLAPQSGEETRAQLQEKVLSYKDMAEEGVIVARERGLEAMEKGQANASEALQKSKAHVTQLISQQKAGQNGHA